VWSDYDTQPQVELSHGIRLDTTYYYWPSTWINNVPGVFTGSGLPMRFAKADGTMIDVYQAPTQMTDESGQSYPFTVDTLLNRALGPEGFYGTFVSNMHTDHATHPDSDVIVASAQARGVPVISSKQLLRWLDGRNNSAFSNLSWGANALTFTVALARGTTGIQAMVPASSAAGALTGVSRNGVSVGYTVQTIKGVSYAMFAALAGDYRAEYNTDTIPPAITGLTATPASYAATVSWTTNESATTRVDYGTSPTLLNQNSVVAGLSLSHSVALSGLSPSTTYYYRVTSADALNNSASAPTPAATFVTGAPQPVAMTDTTAADFSAGTVDAGTYVTQLGDGEVILTPSVGTEFSGTALPTGWSAVAWNGGGTATVAGGRLTVDGSRASLDALQPVGTRLEFGATFSTDLFEHVGFGLTFDETPWAMFSTAGGGGLYARTHDGANPINTLLQGNWLGTPHIYRIDWTAASVVFYIDGVMVANHAAAIGASMRPIASDFNIGGGGVVVDWMHLSPFATTGTFTSRVLDGGVVASWSTASWNASVPTGTSLAISARFGNTPVPDGTWTAFATLTGSGASLSQSSRYVQYRAVVSGNGTDTPTLQDVTFSAPAASGPPPSINITDATVTEGNSGSSNAVFTLTLSAPSTSQVSVGYATANGTAASPADYTAASGTAVFAPGTTSTTVSVPVIGDIAIEGNETFTLNLSAPVNATIARAQAIGTITNDDVPSISIAGASVTEGNSGVTNANFTVTLSAASQSTVTVGYATGGGTATSGTDYTATSGTLTFIAGQTQKTVAVPIIGDLLNEPNETFQVTISNPTNATLGASVATGTITNDDALPQLSIGNATVTEGNSSSVTGSFTVSLSAASAQTVTVNYATSNGTAASGSDYTAASGTVTFSPGATTQTVNVTVLGDTLDEANETFTVALGNPSNATLGTPSSGMGTITDNDTAPSLSIGNSSVTEGNSGTVNATMTVTLSTASGQTVTVNYGTANNSAVAPGDYTSTSGSLTFSAGTTSRTITVPVRGDTLDEGTETLNVNLSGAANATISDSQGTVTINDDDPTPSLTINNFSVTEGNSGTKTTTFAVTLSAASGRTVTVNYATANGTASSSSDYVATSGTLTFAAGQTTQTITVTIRGDNTNENNETFNMNLSNASNASISDSQGVCTILDDD
jgi:hypothetical protein